MIYTEIKFPAWFTPELEQQARDKWGDLIKDIEERGRKLHETLQKYISPKKKNKPIIRIPADYLSIADFMQRLEAKGIGIGDRFSISYKDGKKRRLKSFYLKAYDVDVSHIECCGPNRSIRLIRNLDDDFEFYYEEFKNHNLAEIIADLRQHDLLKQFRRNV